MVEKRDWNTVGSLVPDSCPGLFLVVYDQNVCFGELLIISGGD